MARSATLAMLLVLVSLPVPAAIRLYLKDGGFHEVREYQVLADRVRFYSVERSEWEEIPLDLADLKRTEKEQQDLRDSQRDEVQMQKEENAAERQTRLEVATVPMTAGAYVIENGKVIPVPQGESTVVNDKKRSILKALSPVPIVSGKATVQLKGERSPTVVHTETPEFYMRLDQPERFGIIRLTPKKGARIAEKVTIIPVANQPVEDPDLVEVIRQQVGDGLYKVTPMKTLAPGEYAVVEFTENELNMQIWDFSVAATAERPAASVK